MIRKNSSRCTLVLLAFALSFLPGSLSASPGKRKVRLVKVNKNDTLFSVTLESGQEIECLQKKSRIFAGKSRKQGKMFLSTAARTKPLISRLKRQVKSARSKKAKSRVRKKLTRQRNLIKTHNAACGGLGGSPGAPVSAECSLARYRGPVTTAEIRYLAEKAGFGLSSQEAPLVQLASQQGLPAAVDEFMRTKEENPAVVNRMLDWRDGLLDNEDDFLRGGDRAQRFDGMRAGLLDFYIHTNNAFREKLGIFLWSLWTAGDDVLTQQSQRSLMWDYIDLIRSYAHNPDMINLGIDVTINPLMLIYLNGDQNIALAPNENYGRELMELFSLGPEDLNGNPNYTEEGDIVEISKALTGWTVIEKEVPDPRNRGERIDVWRAVESPADHTPGLKTLFAGTGHAIQVDTYDDAVRAVFQHPNASVYYATEILKEYVTREPPRCLIERFASEIRNADFQLDQPMRTLLTSEAFYHPSYRNTLAKHSVEYAIEFIRTLGIPVSISELRGLLDGNLNMSLTRPPDVFWWNPRIWSSAPVTLAKANLITRIIRNTSAQRRDEEDENDDWLPAEVCPTDPLADEEELIAHVMDAMGVTLPTEDIRNQLLFYASNSRRSDGTFSNQRYDNREESLQRRKCLGMYFIAALTPDFLHK